VGEVARSWDPGADVERAVAALVDVGQNAARALIWLVIVVLPLVLGGALVAALGIGVARWLGPRLRREVGPPPQAPA
jgi:hypothetical protein